MTAADLVFIDATGYNYSDFPTFLAYFTQGYQNIYGPDIDLSPDTQDGQAVTFEAQAAFDAAASGANAYASFSPATAQGVGLSRNVKINGIGRMQASNSTVDLVIVGTAFTTISNGVASDVLNQLWSLPTSVTIPNTGTITVTATAQEEGAISAVSDSVTGIFTPTQGWQTVNNPSEATIGNPIEDDAELRQRQTVSVALPSLTELEGTVGAVANVPGVSAVQPYENDTDSTDSNGLPPHSISLVVSGGTDTDVAQAIQIKKTPGTNTYGTTSVPTVDSHGVPITINFFRPTPAVIGVQITLNPLSAWVSSNETIIAEAVAAFINTMIPIGGTPLDTSGDKGVSYSQLIGVAYVPGTVASGSFIIESIELKKNSGSFSIADVDLVFNEEAVCDPTMNVVFIT